MAVYPTWAPSVVVAINSPDPTIDAARILGLDTRIGSLETGKDGDVALFDGDPFEYTTHCVGVVIEGEAVSQEQR